MKRPALGGGEGAVTGRGGGLTDVGPCRGKGGGGGGVLLRLLLGSIVQFRRESLQFGTL